MNKQSGRRIAAVLPVHVFGHPAEVNRLRAICDAWGLPMVEDAAEALASWREGTHCGLFGAVGTLSFNGNKLITTGGGGALLTNNSDLANARHLDAAKLPHPSFDHDAVGGTTGFPISMQPLVLPSWKTLNAGWRQKNWCSSTRRP